MRRTSATVLGVALAAGLAYAATADNPEELVGRYFAATDEVGLTASWADWHPDATHAVTIIYGLGQPDDTFTYAIAEWANLPDWEQDPSYKEAMKGYVETARHAPVITTKSTADGTVVTAVTRIDYDWQGFSGQARQTDQFFVVTHFGGSVIRSLETTVDYR